jgi:hypothetical protein
MLASVDWLLVFSHFASLSLLAVGGAITTAPDMHRYLVTQQAWLSDTQFTASIALSQAAPGPNVLFIALLGWNLGLNAGGGMGAGWPAVGLALLGVLVSMTATLLPSSILTYSATRWAHRQPRASLGARLQGWHGADRDRVADSHGLAAHRRARPAVDRLAVVAADRRGHLGGLANQNPLAVADRRRRVGRRPGLGVTRSRSQGGGCFTRDSC